RSPACHRVPAREPTEDFRVVGYGRSLRDLSHARGGARIRARARGGGELIAWAADGALREPASQQQPWNATLGRAGRRGGARVFGGARVEPGADGHSEAPQQPVWARTATALERDRQPISTGPGDRSIAIAGRAASGGKGHHGAQARTRCRARTRSRT